MKKKPPIKLFILVAIVLPGLFFGALFYAKPDSDRFSKNIRMLVEEILEIANKSESSRISEPYRYLASDAAEPLDENYLDSLIELQGIHNRNNKSNPNLHIQKYRIDTVMTRYFSWKEFNNSLKWAGLANILVVACLLVAYLRRDLPNATNKILAIVSVAQIVALPFVALGKDCMDGDLGTIVLAYCVAWAFLAIFFHLRIRKLQIVS